jgi:hypothetical protein
MREIQISLKKRIRGETEKQIEIQRKKNREINQLKVMVDKSNMQLRKAEKEIETNQDINRMRKDALLEARAISDKSFEYASEAHKVANHAKMELSKFAGSKKTEILLEYLTREVENLIKKKDYNLKLKKELEKKHKMLERREKLLKEMSIMEDKNKKKNFA